MLNWNLITDALFDMDGTLLDLRFDNWFWLEHLPQVVAEMFGCSLEEAKARLPTFTPGAKKTLAYFSLRAWGEHLGIDAVRLHESCSTQVAILPGAVRVVHVARAAGCRTGIVTNASPETLGHKLVRVPNFFRNFDFVVSTGELGFVKEDPRCWDALDGWLAERGMPPIRRESATYADDNTPVLESLAKSGFRREHLFYITKPDSTLAARPPSEHYRSVEGVYQLV